MIYDYHAADWPLFATAVSSLLSPLHHPQKPQSTLRAFRKSSLKQLKLSQLSLFPQNKSSLPAPYLLFIVPYVINDLLQAGYTISSFGTGLANTCALNTDAWPTLLRQLITKIRDFKDNKLNTLCDRIEDVFNNSPASFWIAVKSVSEIRLLENTNPTANFPFYSNVHIIVVYKRCPSSVLNWKRSIATLNTQISTALF